MPELKKCQCTWCQATNDIPEGEEAVIKCSTCSHHFFKPAVDEPERMPKCSLCERRVPSVFNHGRCLACLTK